MVWMKFRDGNQCFTTPIWLIGVVLGVNIRGFVISSLVQKIISAVFLHISAINQIYPR
jgi:hypothetical protein